VQRRGQQGQEDEVESDLLPKWIEPRGRLVDDEQERVVHERRDDAGFRPEAGGERGYERHDEDGESVHRSYLTTGAVAAPAYFSAGFDDAVPTGPGDMLSA
jgi:hypothetical protein